MYVGAHVPRNLFAWVGAWLGLIAVVVAGATNLFFISRRFGRRLAEGRFAEAVPLSHERLDKAEKWVDKYGVVAHNFGRPIPGFRVPITLPALEYQLNIPTLAPTLPVSTPPPAAT